MNPFATRWSLGRGLAALAWAGLTALTGCGGGGSDFAATPIDAAPPPSASAVIGAEGGSLVGPDGVHLEAPAGALTAPTTTTMTRDGSGAPALIDGQSPIVDAITPEVLPGGVASELNGLPGPDSNVPISSGVTLP